MKSSGSIHKGHTERGENLVTISQRGVGRGGGWRGRTTPSFWGQILYISYIKCLGRDQCKNNPFKT